jgi:alkanesulfonate monooxygenase SsuD/methylene tetrahydromethanopterin reductase-like flavin-dependent oxidoreductase (luciferase family)
MVATLDVISEGRIELGIDAGWLEDEFIRYGLLFDNAKIRSQQLAEALLVISRAYSGISCIKYYCS